MMRNLGNFWRNLRQRLLPNGSRGERAYHRLRLALLILSQNRLAKSYPWIRQFLEIERLSSRVGGGADRKAYARWMRTHEPNPAQLQKQAGATGQFPLRPLISIITPVYNPDPHILADTVRSVQQQTYPHWEWCLADASSHSGPAEVLQQAQKGDPRLKIARLEQNGGISANSMAALALAGGEFVLMLDHDDLLSPDALFEIVATLNRMPTADVLYYDEDKVSENGQVREEPWFKPDTFSPLLLFSTNFLMHSAIRTSLIRQVLPLRTDLDGAQDWDLAFRLSDLQPNFVHIPRILYHWRRAPGSVAARFDAKPWAVEAQLRCLQARLEQIGLPQARAGFAGPGITRVHWPIPTVRISILIPTRDNLTKLKPCLETLLSATQATNYEVLVIDNGSQKAETLAYYQTLAAEPRVRLLSYPHPFNFQRINNLAARQATGEVLVFLNDDTLALTPDWLGELTGWLQLAQVGIVGARLTRPDGSIQHNGIVMGLAGHGSHLYDGGQPNTYGIFGSTEWYRDCLAVTGACLAIRRELFWDLRGFDEAYQVGYGDIDLCLRAVAAGQRVLLNPFARLLHHEGASRGFHIPAADVLRASAAFMARIRAGDPYFNPNLSAFSRIPAIAGANEPERSLTIEKILQDFELYTPGVPTAFNQPDWWHNLPAAPVNPAPREARSILLVSHELSRTGAPLLFYNLALGLKAAGYSLQVLSPLGGPLEADYRQAGIPVSVIPFVLDDARLALPLAAACDVVLANSITSWRCIYAAQAMGKKSLWFIHEGHNGQAMAKQSQALQKAFATAGKIFFPNQTIASYYHALLFVNNYQLLPYGIVMSIAPSQQLCKGKLTGSNDILILVNIASIEHRKGQDLLLQAMGNLTKPNSDHIHLYLIGRALEQSEPAFVKKIKARASKMSNVHLLGELNRTEVLNFLSTADGLIVTSRDEALPVVVLEAMALGKPVLSTRAGGIPEVIEHERNGLLFENFQPDSIAREITRFATQPHLRSTLAKNALQDFQARPNQEQYCAEVIKQIQKFEQDPGEVKSLNQI